METDFYAALLVPPYEPDPDWAARLTESLLHPQFPISMWEALGRRLRLNYLWIYLVLLGVWLAKLLLYPESVASLDMLVTRARMGIAPGWLVMTVVLAFYALLIGIAFVTRNLRHAVGEIFPRYGESKPVKSQLKTGVDPQMNTQTKTPEPYPLLAIITAHQLDPIATAIQEQIKRPARRLDPNNTSGTQASLLLAVTLTEIAALKALVKGLDSEGVVVVIPATDVSMQKVVQESQDAQG
jgi:hypothetical protein